VTFTGRGVANFNTGQFAAADDDFEQSLSLDARDGDVVLWLHLARARSNRDDAQELASNARMLDPKTWPGPILAYYLGRVDADEVMRAAGNGSADMPRNQSCQAYFFVGEDAVLRQDIDEAARLLRQARDTCALDSFKHAAAEFELKRLPK
jgi:lipoprotein NlpI